MKEEKFKVLLYLKKSSPDKSGNVPIMGRITVDKSIAQFSCKLSCKLNQWNARESRLNGKSKIAVETNAKLDKLLLSINEAYASLKNRKQTFDASDVKYLFQGSVASQMTLLNLYDRYIEELQSRVGIDVAKGTIPNYTYSRRYLGDFIKEKFNASDLSFGQLNEQFIRDFQDYVLLDKGFANDTLRHYLAILKKICKIAYKEGHSEKCHFAYYKLPKQKETTPKALSRNDFEKIRDLQIDEKRVSHILTKDLFLFACYVGTAYADVVSITKENLITDENGELWLKYRRKKNELLAHTDNDIPEEIRDKDIAKAFYGLTLESLDDKIQNKIVKTQISLQTALKIDELIKHAVLENNHPIVDWQSKSNITGKLQIEIGDYLIDEVRDKYNVSLLFGEMDEIANKCIEVAKLRYK